MGDFYVPVMQTASDRQGRCNKLEKPGYRKPELALVREGVSKPEFYLALLLSLIIILNYYDIMHTIALCASGAAMEGNPIMRFLLEKSPGLALVMKMGVVLLFSIVMLIYARTHLRRAFLITSLVTLVYLLVAIWHLAESQIPGWFF